MACFFDEIECFAKLWAGKHLRQRHPHHVPHHAVMTNLRIDEALGALDEIEAVHLFELWLDGIRATHNSPRKDVVGQLLDVDALVHSRYPSAEIISYTASPDLGHRSSVPPKGKSFDADANEVVVTESFSEVRIQRAAFSISSEIAAALVRSSSRSISRPKH